MRILILLAGLALAPALTPSLAAAEPVEAFAGRVGQATLVPFGDDARTNTGLAVGVGAFFGEKLNSNFAVGIATDLMATFNEDTGTFDSGTTYTVNVSGYHAFPALEAGLYLGPVRLAGRAGYVFSSFPQTTGGLTESTSTYSAAHEAFGASATFFRDSTGRGLGIGIDYTVLYDDLETIMAELVWTP